MQWNLPTGVRPLVPDRELTPHFWLHEFPVWWLATPYQVAELRGQLTRFWEPLRAHTGRLIPTSWLWWSSGIRRANAHTHPGTVDMVPLTAHQRFQQADEQIRAGNLTGAGAYQRAGESLVSDAHRWAADHLRGMYGELIDERDHLHATAPGIGGAGEVLHEPQEGVYYAGLMPEKWGRDFPAWLAVLILGALVLGQISLEAHEGIRRWTT